MCYVPAFGVYDVMKVHTNSPDRCYDPRLCGNLFGGFIFIAVSGR